MEAEDAEVLENEATELRCVVTLSNPDSELATATIEKVDTNELLSSTRLGYIARYCVYVSLCVAVKATEETTLHVLYQSFLLSRVLQ